MRITIQRIHQPDCTVGMLTLDEHHFRCFTLELPYRDNAKNVSCIPPGLYPCTKVVSPKFGNCIAVNNVCGRSLIRIHKGNYTRQIEGCILPGQSLADIDGDGIPDVTSSAKTVEKLLSLLPEEFTLQVI